MKIPIHNTQALTALTAIGLVCLLPVAQAESLFRTGTTYYEAQTGMAPRSLYTPPIAHNVGDVITILVKEKSSLKSDAELKITRTHEINENGTSLFNGTVGFLLDKIPGTSKLQEKLTVPSFSGMDNSNQLGSKAESERTTELEDSITCQVVQILPNGHLMVQGQKTVQVNKERQDIILTGIVNPFYLDRRNQISSNQVANMQLLQGGKGVISRQQNDGFANKIYQFFN